MLTVTTLVFGVISIQRDLNAIDDVQESIKGNCENFFVPVRYTLEFSLRENLRTEHLKQSEPFSTANSFRC